MNFLNLKSKYNSDSSKYKRLYYLQNREKLLENSKNYYWKKKNNNNSSITMKYKHKLCTDYLFHQYDIRNRFSFLEQSQVSLKSKKNKL